MKTEASTPQGVTMPNKYELAEAQMAKQIAELRALMAKATPGPWHTDYTEIGDGPDRNLVAFVMAENERYVVVDESPDEIDGEPSPDCALIVAAINALPALLDRSDELDRVKAERDRLLQDSRDLTDANTDFRRDMWTLSKERQDAIDELAKAEAEIAELRETLEHVQGSDVTLMELLAAEKRKTEHWRAEAKNMLVSGRRIAESIAAQRDVLKISTSGQYTYTRISDCPNCRTWTNEAAHQCAVCEGRSIAMQVSQFDPQSVADTAIIVASGETTTDMGTSFAIGTQPTSSCAPADGGLSGHAPFIQIKDGPS